MSIHKETRKIQCTQRNMKTCNQKNWQHRLYGPEQLSVPHARNLPKKKQFTPDAITVCCFRKNKQKDSKIEFTSSKIFRTSSHMEIRRSNIGKQKCHQKRESKKIHNHSEEMEICRTTGTRYHTQYVLICKADMNSRKMSIHDNVKKTTRSHVDSTNKHDTTETDRKTTSFATSMAIIVLFYCLDNLVGKNRERRQRTTKLARMARPGWNWHL